DALCRRYGIDNSHRTRHGALLDSELLAEVYIELIGGKQAALGLELAGQVEVVETRFTVEIRTLQRPAPLAPRISVDDRDAHARLVAELGENALWAKLADRLAGREAV